MPTDLPETRLRALADAATQGEWEAYSAICCPDMGGVSTGSSRVCEVLSAKLGRFGHPCMMTDAALIAYAASPDRVRAIAAVVEAARRVCAEVGYGLATSQRIDAMRAAVHALDGLP